MTVRSRNEETVLPLWPQREGPAPKVWEGLFPNPTPYSQNDLAVRNNSVGMGYALADIIYNSGKIFESGKSNI